MTRTFRLACLALALLAVPLSARADSGFPYISNGTNSCQVIAPGSVWFTGFSLGNNVASTGYLKLYDMNTTPTVGITQGTTNGALPYPFMVPGNTAGAGSNPNPIALKFNTGLAMCFTGGASNTDTSVPGVSQIVGVIFYTGQYPR